MEDNIELNEEDMNEIWESMDDTYRNQGTLEEQRDFKDIQNEFLEDRPTEERIEGVDVIRYEMKESAFRGNLKSYSIDPHDSESLLTYLNDISDVIREIITRELNQLRGIKYDIRVRAQMSRISPAGEERIDNAYFETNKIALVNDTEINQSLEDVYARIISNQDNFTNKGSNWVFDRVIGCWVNIDKYQGSEMVVILLHLQDGRIQNTN